jgi:hypothetical protein
MYQALAIPLVLMIQADHWVMDVKFIQLDAAWTARNSRMREKNQEAKSTDYRQNIHSLFIVLECPHAAVGTNTFR